MGFPEILIKKDSYLRQGRKYVSSNPLRNSRSKTEVARQKGEGDMEGETLMKR
jgi:hypothetical protein